MERYRAEDGTADRANQQCGGATCSKEKTTTVGRRSQSAGAGRQVGRKSFPPEEDENEDEDDTMGSIRDLVNVAKAQVGELSSILHIYIYTVVGSNK